MSDLTNTEKRKFEKLLGMGSGYVLDFLNRTFEEFVRDSVRREIYDSLYDCGSGSKANRLRGFWNEEPNAIVGKLMNDMLAYGIEIGLIAEDHPSLIECRKTVTRLMLGSPVAELDALSAISDERDFEVVAKAVRDAIERNEPESGLDRLHTFIVKYIRSLCQKRGMIVTRDKPLHSLFGEYVRSLKVAGHIESAMAERILKSSISTLEAFNHVRNNQSLAHDNPILSYDEALLIFNHVASSIRFLRSLDGRVSAREARDRALSSLDEIPF